MGSAHNLIIVTTLKTYTAFVLKNAQQSREILFTKSFNFTTTLYTQMHEADENIEDSVELE